MKGKQEHQEKEKFYNEEKDILNFLEVTRADRIRVRSLDSVYLAGL